MKPSDANPFLLQTMYKIIDEQKALIRLYALLIICLIVVIGYIVTDRNAQVKIIESQNGSITTQEKTIKELRGQIKAMEEHEEAVAFEKAITRGSKRTAVVTAYTYTGQKTASGTWPKEGRTVAGPRTVPFGTVVWIDGIGERIVEDRTNSRFEGRYDVFMESQADCLEWGIQERIIR